MEDIICIILIFFLLGLFVYHFRPIFEGIDECDTDFVYDPRGEEGNLDGQKQKDYNKNKEQRDETFKKKSCLINLWIQNKTDVKSYNDEEHKDLNSNYKKKIIPTSKSFEETRKKFLKSVDALDEIVKDDAGGNKKEDEDTECGEITDPVGASPHEDIGKPMPSKGASCS